MEKNKNFAIGTILTLVIFMAIIFYVVLCSQSATPPIFLNDSEYEVIERYIADTEEQQTFLAGIADSRKLSDAELALIDNAILKLSQSTKALEDIIGAAKD